MIAKFPTLGQYGVVLYCRKVTSDTNATYFALEYQVDVAWATRGGAKCPKIWPVNEMQSVSIVSPPPSQGVLASESRMRIAVVCRGVYGDNEFADRLKLHACGKWINKTVVSKGNGMYEVNFVVPQSNCNAQDSVMLLKKTKGTDLYSVVCEWVVGFEGSEGDRGDESDESMISDDESDDSDGSE